MTDTGAAAVTDSGAAAVTDTGAAGRADTGGASAVAYTGTARGANPRAAPPEHRYDFEKKY